MIDSIRTRLIATFISLAIFPLVILGGVLIWQDYIVEIGQIKESQQRETALASENITIFLHEQENKILTLMNMHYFPGMSLKEQKAELSKFLSIAKDTEHGYVFDNFIFIDSKGKEAFRVSRINFIETPVYADWSDSELYTEPLSTGSIFYSHVFFSEYTGEPILDMAVPIFDIRTLEPRGILIAEMRLEFLWHLVSTLKIGKQGTAYLTDKDGRVVVHPDISMVLKNSRIDIPDTSRIMPGLNGEQAVVAVQKIKFGNLPLYFVTEVPRSEALQYINTSIYILGTILLLTLVCSIAIVVIVVRQMVTPLESLAGTAREITRGDYSKMAKPHKIKEFSELSHAFNSMTGRLHETISNLESQIDFVENIFESLGHPLYVIDVNDYTVKMANSAANFGALTSDSKCHMLTHKTDTPCGGPEHPCTIEEIKKTGKPVMMQHMHCTQNEDAPRMYEVYGYPILNEKGEITQVIEYNIDISDRKNLEDQLRQAQKLEAIGSLASGIAHDFNNLLTTILGYGELLLMKLPENDPIREKIEAIYEAGQRAATLTRQLLAFSRKQVLDIRVINLNSLLDNLTKMISRMIGENVEIRMLLEPSAGNIMVDPGQVEQVVMNLAINARDAMPDGGTITIETQRVDLDEEYCKIHVEAKPGTYAVLYVTDNGKGMGPEVMEKIFEPFYTTKEKGAGTGLGLATVYGIVKQHNGHIYVYSEVGSGTTFKIYFPQVQKAAEGMTSKVFPAMERGVETILVADDEISIRKLVRDTLEPLGYKIIEAADGEEALELFRQHEFKIDMLITDVIMPKMTGAKLAEALITEKPGFNKVLYMSGYTDNAIVHQGILDKEIEFINKPLVPSHLTKKIREVLAK